MSRRAGLLLVLGAMALGALLLEPRLAYPTSFDGLHFYLPMARELLAKGWAYMHEEASVSYAPLAFAWPALLGAHEYLVRYANIALYCASIFFAYLAIREVHGERAGVAAAILVAICPTVRPFIGDVMTEAPCIFLTAAWLLCVARVAAGGGAGWVVAGGIAFALCVLVRPVAMYFAPAALVILAWKRQWKLAGMHGVATALVGLWVLRNALVFGFPAVAAGAGGALYFGVNPLVDGFDPPYYGMAFDSGVAQDSLSHLSIHGDRTLRAIGALEVFETPLSIVIPMFAHKAASFVFVSQTAYTDDELPWLRTWRIVAVVFGLVGLAFNRRNFVVAVIAGLVAYMVIVHVPLLYTHRYSVGALDLPLAMLAAVGMAEAMRSAARISAALTVCVPALAAGLMHATEIRGDPMPDRIPTEVAWQQKIDREAVIGPGEHLDIDIPSTSPEGWDMAILDLELAVARVTGTRCDTMLVRYRKSAQPAFDPWRVIRVAVKQGDGLQRYDIGATVPLGVTGAGTIRLEPECNGISNLAVGTAAVLISRRQFYYRDLYKARR